MFRCIHHAISDFAFRNKNKLCTIEIGEREAWRDVMWSRILISIYIMERRLIMT